jgi:hypothetical protein
VRKSVRGFVLKRCSNFLNLEHLICLQVILPKGGILSAPLEHVPTGLSECGETDEIDAQFRR